MSTYLMDLKQVCHAVGFQKTTIYKWMNTGDFPKSIKIGGSVRWVSEEVQAWISEKITKSKAEIR
ncbi:helix-turn-helix transcriptional regulator [Enterobacter ludwigii]|uniref:helix-turn-helix transcriptional regulator n=1 Tax=Enterobacter ludwigii TaxID=299767 RepID=UPI00046D343D|nr:AlpA family phage regulatory protein [Enterobacter ludwigii]